MASLGGRRSGDNDLGQVGSEKSLSNFLNRFDGESESGKMNTQFMKVSFESLALGSKRTTEFIKVIPWAEFFKTTR